MCGRFMMKWVHPEDDAYSYFTCEYCSVQSSLPGTYRRLITASRCQADACTAWQYDGEAFTFIAVPAIDHSLERVMHP